MKHTTSLLLCLSLLPQFYTNKAFTQNIKDEVVEYKYIQLPSSPLSKNIKNYQSSIEAPYEEKNKALMKEYEAKQQEADLQYEKEKAAYPALVKAAEEKYNKEMEEYNKKSLGTKVMEKSVLGENNKPVKYIPPEPYPRVIEKPALKTSYDYPVLCSTYLRLDGFENKPDNAVKIIVTMYGFDFTQPRVLSEQKSVAEIGKSGTRQVTYYHVEYSYRHPMSVKVITPDGKEVLNVTPSEFNNYTVYKTNASETYPQFNPELLVKTNEEKLVQENLKAINAIVNEKFGFARLTRKATLYYVKSKGEEYADLMGAFNEVSSGLKIVTDDPEQGKPKVLKAIDAWKKALLESDPSNKKARIDKDVTIAVSFNLLEACFAMNNLTTGFEIIQKLNGMDISSKERKRKDEFEQAYNDIKKRVLSNQ